MVLSVTLLAQPAARIPFLIKNSAAFLVKPYLTTHDSFE